MGAFQDGYASDMTRMVFLGKPNPKIRKMYEAVLEAQLAAIEAVREGVTAARVDRAARDVLKAVDLDKAFVHSTGHGLGLEIHEPPRLGKKDKTRLEAGMVVTIEPGVYVERIWRHTHRRYGAGDENRVRSADAHIQGANGSLDGE